MRDCLRKYDILSIQYLRNAEPDYLVKHFKALRAANDPDFGFTGFSIALEMVDHITEDGELDESSFFVRVGKGREIQEQAVPLQNFLGAYSNHFMVALNKQDTGVKHMGARGGATPD